MEENGSSRVSGSENEKCIKRSPKTNNIWCNCKTWEFYKELINSVLKRPKDKRDPKVQLLTKLVIIFF